MHAKTRSAQKADRNKKPTQSTQFSFVHTDNPTKGTSTETLKLIRSHASKDFHEQKRRRRLAGLQHQPPTGCSSKTSGPCKSRKSTFTCEQAAWEEFLQGGQQWGQYDALDVYHHAALNPPGTWSKSLGNKVQRITVRCRAPGAALTFHTPHFPVGDGRTYVREVSTVELFLLDNYLQFTKTHINRVYKDEDMKNTVNMKLKQYWISYCMNHEGLIETLFLKAAHTLATRSPDEETAARWRLLAYTYKQKCLEKAIEATRREGLLASDSTISLIVSIAFDELLMGDHKAWYAHGHGAIEMVKRRGGLSAISSLDGLLAQMLEWSIFNPQFKLTSGPCYNPCPRET